MIHPAFAKAGYFPSEEQKRIAAHKRGPLLVIAGPGSGKTRSLVLLAMNLLLCEDAKPEEIVLCTYTEKAAYELQDRLSELARDVKYAGDVSRMKIGTIHGICQQLVNEHLLDTSLSSGYETLDQFTQQLLIFQHLEEICGDRLAFWQGRQGTPWSIAKELKSFFDIITEELLIEKLEERLEQFQGDNTHKSMLLSNLTEAYRCYRRVLTRSNCIDFAHLQKWAHRLLNQQGTQQKVTRGVRYVLVDEYQDTNYIQEQVLIALASGSEPRNLIVIGDEDQALYRFRGATVRNILWFARETFPHCAQLSLTMNHRSQQEIVLACNRWISEFDWSNGTGHALRTEKVINARRIEQRLVPAVLRLEAQDLADEAEQMAELIAELKTQGTLADYSDAAILLYSVKGEESQAYIQALEQRAIPVYCPRARTFFDQSEIRLVLGGLARLLSYTPDLDDEVDPAADDFRAYIELCLHECKHFCQRFPTFARDLHRIAGKLNDVAARGEQFTAQYILKAFYQLVFSERVIPLLEQERRLSNLVKFSHLLDTFHKYAAQRSHARIDLAALGKIFFERFFVFLYREGMNEEEEHQLPFLAGHVQIMTIHQAKGLEFPVVIVGRLDRLARSSTRNERKLLQPYFHHEPFEPPNAIARYDCRRLYYVAFSRAKDLLVLSAIRQPDRDLIPLWQESVRWQEKRTLFARNGVYESHKDAEVAKPRYGLTTHIQTYQTCPRRYHYFYSQHFAPTRADTFWGQLIHQTIEQLHRQVLVDASRPVEVAPIFEKIYNRLLYTTPRQVPADQKNRALRQVVNYYQQNQQFMPKIHGAELPIQIDRDAYILQGKIDLVVHGEQGLEIIDFKTQQRPTDETGSLAFYRQQLLLYAHALHIQTGTLPQRLWLYWTAEERREDALMEVACHPESVTQTVAAVDDVAHRIKKEQFSVGTLPNPAICRKCELQLLCQREGKFVR